MTTLTRFVPFRSPLQDVAVLQNRLNSIFSDFTRPDAGDEVTAGNFIPAVDIYEDAQKLVLKLEVPGIRQDDLQLHIENQTLSIKGERRFESNEKEENFHRIERRYGSFMRNFTLPQSVDASAIEAHYDAGVLSVSLPKKAESKPRQIKIAVNGARQIEAIKPAEEKKEDQQASKTAA